MRPWFVWFCALLRFMNTNTVYKSGIEWSISFFTMLLPILKNIQEIKCYNHCTDMTTEHQAYMETPQKILNKLNNQLNYKGCTKTASEIMHVYCTKSDLLCQVFTIINALFKASLLTKYSIQNIQHVALAYISNSFKMTNTDNH